MIGIYIFYGNWSSAAFQEEVDTTKHSHLGLLLLVNFSRFCAEAVLSLILFLLNAGFSKRIDKPRSSWSLLNATERGISSDDPFSIRREILHTAASSAFYDHKVVRHGMVKKSQRSKGQRQHVRSN